MSVLNSLIVRSLPLVPKPVVKTVAKRYIAGDTLKDAVHTVQQLARIGATSTVDVLGEFVSSRERAEHECAASDAVLEAFHTYNLNAYLSVKLTSLGFDIDDEFCYKNILALVTKAHEYGLFVRLDMENSPYTTRTLDLYKKLRSNGFDNVGVVIQAYLHRSEEDIRSLVRLNADVRLCKGIYVEDASIAFKDRGEVQRNYKKLLRMLLDGGCSTHIATHDDVLIDDAQEYTGAQNIDKQQYEFQMLLGVREERRNDIISDGYRMRIYVPFGEDWYGYSVRRLKENPQIAGYVLKALLTGE
ncbi:MAG: proline dehydrogenase family protein [Candidatus Kapabacteria bacterium]|nr:proline dehydrogenase family protein [Candidatus Kapabacteria bacterium]